MSKKKSPFDYVKNINTKADYDYDLSGYVPFLTNRAMAMHMDTVMFAEEMNQYHQLDPFLQYDFYHAGVRKGRRFGFPKKCEDHPQLELVMQYYQYSREKAMQALEILSESDLTAIRRSLDTGGM
jgi:citrate lyase beta subunit